MLLKEPLPPRNAQTTDGQNEHPPSQQAAIEVGLFYDSRIEQLLRLRRSQVRGQTL
jgi:hypothetical protein